MRRELLPNGRSFMFYGTYTIVLSSCGIEPFYGVVHAFTVQQTKSDLEHDQISLMFSLLFSNNAPLIFHTGSIKVRKTPLNHYLSRVLLEL